ncbi:hypothetical protein F4804DRAFT_64552 [Jackrogersella minutella]|nr:hypothetical protein F4804DRAFT_64552 [Jackrogersella minutella]
MTVTEIAVLPSSTPGEVPQALHDIGLAGIALQGEWCAVNAPWLIQDRGAALFQQLEDPGVLLITAHWDSIDQHHACLATPANQKLLVDTEPCLDTAKMRPGHIEGIKMFPGSEDEGLTPALKAPIIVVTIWTVPRENKAQFEEAMKRVQENSEVLNMPYRRRGGWKIEKAKGEEEIEQYFVVGGLENVETSATSTKDEGHDEHYQTLSPLASNVEIKHYKRIG